MRKQASRDYREGLLKALQDPAEAAAYLNAALEESSQEAFLLALKDVCEARGISTVSKEAQLNRENMYRILSKNGNPKLSTLTACWKSQVLNWQLLQDSMCCRSHHSEFYRT